MNPAWRRRARGLIVPVALIAAIQVAMTIAPPVSDSLASPLDTLRAGLAMLADGTLLRATFATLWCGVAGLAIGGAIGLILGTLFGMFPVLDRLMQVTIEALRPIPPVAIIPVALLILGLGYRMEIAVVAVATPWPVLIITRAAVRSIEPQWLEVGRALRLNAFDRIRKIVLPAALPRIFVAFRLTAGVALTVAVTVEIAANANGLGYGIMLAQQSLRPAAMLAYLVWIGVIGWALNTVLIAAQRRFFGAAALSGKAD